MACSRYQFRYGTGGVLSATYATCGDNTPVTLTDSGGVSGALYLLSAGLVCGAGPGIVIATTGSVITYTGFASAGGTPVPGFVYTQVIKPWSQYVAASAAGGQEYYPGA